MESVDKNAMKIAFYIARIRRYQIGRKFKNTKKEVICHTLEC